MGYQIAWMGESDSTMLGPQEYFLIKGKYIIPENKLRVLNRRFNSQVICSFALLLSAETKGIVTERNKLFLVLRISEPILTETTNMNK